MSYFQIAALICNFGHTFCIIHLKLLRQTTMVLFFLENFPNSIAVQDPNKSVQGGIFLEKS